MKKRIILSAEAKQDIAELKRYIRHELKMPDTAARYIKELNAVIQELPNHADSVGMNEYIQGMFGFNARHAIFKRMIIIFYPKNHTIYIRRIIPGSLVY
ncbi:MAG: type II toxin-antitoxin system RelE/ParE family toxin [Tannerella sp.]|jgi:plasmid stabilization system protein ParE|nr:type II toxin-antitoxin system RelE/ParE family toxin [Tannerella sp.]